MKKLVFLCAAGLVCLTACNRDKLQQTTDRSDMTEDSLQVALANQDSLLVLLNDITDGMNQIKDLEQILTSTTDLTAESQSRKAQIKSDMAAIQQALQERRERLAALESKLKSSQNYNATLKKTIDNLKAEISNQEATISTLRNDLASAMTQIASLDSKVDSLNTTVATVSEERSKAQAESRAAIGEVNKLNTVYYAVGSTKELKEAKIIETGFMRKTKIMQGDFQQAYFTKADKRTLTVIPTHAPKAKILSNMPAGSYDVVKTDGNVEIHITDPSRFWSLSNYLVIQVD